MPPWTFVQLDGSPRRPDTRTIARRRSPWFLAAAATGIAALAACSTAQAASPYFELGAVQCLNGGELRTYPPPVMKPTNGSGPEAVAWSPKVVVVSGDSVVDFDVSAPYYRASTNSIGYGFTPFGRGFYGAQGQLSFVPFRGLPPGRYYVRHMLWWEASGDFFAYGPGCDFFGPAAPGTPVTPPVAPVAPAPPPAADYSNLFARTAPKTLTWRQLRRGYTVRIRSVGAGSRLGARLSVGGRRLAHAVRRAPGSTPVSLTLRASQRQLRRIARTRWRYATLELTARPAGGAGTYTTRRQVRLRRG